VTISKGRKDIGNALTRLKYEKNDDRI